MNGKKPEPARTSVFATPDLSSFRPKPQPAGDLPTPQDIDRATAGSKFSRGDALATESKPETDSRSSESQPETKRRPMVYRTGRNQVLSVKTTPQMVERFYQLAEANGWKSAETFEKAVEALEAAIRKKGRETNE